MKLEFIDDTTGGGKYPDADPVSLIRLYDFSQEEACRLRALISTTLLLEGNQLDLSKVDFVQEINCSLCFHVFSEDEGIVTMDQEHFSCNLTVASYAAMVDLMEPFCNSDPNGYQWLYDLLNPIDLLFSSDGQW